jgi:AcrR family transcriptional regulator
MLDQFFPAADPDNNPDPAQQFAAVTDVYRQLTPTDTEYALWLEFQLYALRHPDLREHMRERQRAQFAALVELLTHHLAAAGVTDPPIPVQALAQLYTAVFDTLARERALDPDAIPDNLFATLTTFINDSIQHPPNQPRPPRKRTPKARS